MKQFACGDIVPGCRSVFHGTEDEILAAVAGHAAADHGLTVLPTGLVEQVRASITVSA